MFIQNGVCDHSYIKAIDARPRNYGNSAAAVFLSDTYFKQLHSPKCTAVLLFVDVAIQPELRFIAKQNSLINQEQRQSRFGPIRRIYALLDDRFDELPNQTENKIIDSC
ncbi:hypothetical protein TNCV_4751841 [Trichonephila clavipes]|nr:hypothetical protein TNCV_4751841 [Trichonephila clavipes]